MPLLRSRPCAWPPLSLPPPSSFPPSPTSLSLSIHFSVAPSLSSLIGILYSLCSTIPKTPPCTCTHMYIHVCVYMHRHVNVCTYNALYIHVLCLCVHTHACIRMYYLCTHVLYLYLCMYIHMHVCTRVCTCIVWPCCCRVCSLSYNLSNSSTLDKHHCLCSTMGAPFSPKHFRKHLDCNMLISTPVLRVNTGNICMHVRKQLQ
jgi:hypothetical protein